MVNEDKLTDYQGCLIGGAVGDSLGAPIEFLSVDQITQKYGVHGVQDYVEFEGGVGEFTDDTQMLLFTAEGLLRSKHRAMLKGIGGSLHQITYSSYLRWLKTQDYPYFGKSQHNLSSQLESGWLVHIPELATRRYPGNTCLESLSQGIQGTVKNPVNNSKGCGTIMRIAPVGLIFSDDVQLAFEEGVNLSALTHGHPSAYLSGGFFSGLIACLANRKPLRESIYEIIEILEGWKEGIEVKEAVLKALSKSEEVGFEKLTSNDISEIGAGWVAEEALGIALLCALRYDHDFKGGVLAAINHSGDSDSTGSITGNILGLINGLKGIPAQWRENLKSYELVLQVGEDLAIGVKGNQHNPNDGWWDKYPGF